MCGMHECREGPLKRPGRCFKVTRLVGAGMAESGRCAGCTSAAEAMDGRERAMCRMHECRGGHGWPRAAWQGLTRIARRRFSGLRPACGVQNAGAFCRTGVLIHFHSTAQQKRDPLGPFFVEWRAMCRMHECRGGHGWPRAAWEGLTRIARRRFSGLRPACGVQNANAFCRTGVLIHFHSTAQQKKGPVGSLFC